LKKLDKYIIKTFFGPFLFIFSVLFFIFIVNIIWTQMSQLTGKGLTYWEITKFLFYLGISVVSMVLPLTILLSSIMTFGDFGERYELAAMKAAGISLVRVMMPLFVTVSLLSVALSSFPITLSLIFRGKRRI
jgi:lipopolysaccharide export system permease protein